MVIPLLEETGALQAASSPNSKEEIDFTNQIRPILSAKCFACHGPDANHREGDLRLDTLEGATGDLGGYSAIAPGEPAKSELIVRITDDDPDTRMPPADAKKQLTANELDLLTRWIEQGASWSDHWAYEPPKRHPVPDVLQGDFPANWVDHFILRRLQSEGLRPSPEADRVTLIRRLSFDLTGLPPTPDEVNQFVNDESPGAYEALVDRLLASTHYGERLAMYWLDLVRYADTVGYHGDQDHHISPYRDYVIDAFNNDLPFDQFTREQLAGDLLPQSTVDQKIASGYNRLLQTSHEGGVQPKEYLAIYAADRMRNLSNVWMGVTLGCCQCHDHKYDPFTMKDFYSLIAFFADLDEARHFDKATDVLPTARPPELAVLTKQQRLRVTELEEALAHLKAQQDQTASTDRSATPRSSEQIATLEEQLAAVRAQARKTMVSVAIEPRPIRILPRGNWLDDSGPLVEPAIPEQFGTLNVQDRRPTRLDLAIWLTDSQTGVGPLTARVFVNRFWYLLFGVAIAPTQDDFGTQAGPPVHPELLDNLAVEFVECGWSVKHTVKLIVMSRTYRQSSQASVHLRQLDPYNQLAARQSRYRLPAEIIRDNALAISGLLVLESGGASIKPYQPAGYYRHLNFPTRKYEHHADQRQWRRGVYCHWQRQFLHPMLKAFDAPSREECTVQRPISNTPLAALTALNDPTFVEAARKFAERILLEGGETTPARLEFAFRQAISRRPDQFEIDTVTQLLDASRRQYQQNPAAARELIGTGLAPFAKEVNPIELASWTAVARAILNMHETITRS
jgi:hypothetical protein